MNVLKRFEFTIFLILTVSLFPLFLGCSNEIFEKEDLASVSLSIGYGSKALSVTESFDSLVFRYNIVKTNELPASDISLWPLLDSDKRSVTVMNLIPGSYKVFVSAYKGQEKMYEGFSETVLLSGCRNEVSVNLNPVPGNDGGTVKLNISGECTSVNVICKKVGSTENKTLEVKSSGSANKTFIAEATLSTGSWIAQVVFFKNGVQAGGETLAFEISPGSVATLSGSLGSGLIYTTGNNILSTLTRSIENGKSETFTYVSNGQNCRYKWCLDDDSNVVSTSASYTFKSTEGVHRLKCFVNDSTNPYLCVVTCYYKKTVQFSYNDLADTFEDTDLVCIGFKENGQMFYPWDNKVFTVTNPTFSKLTSCEQIGITPVYPQNDNDLLNAWVLIVGSNAAMTSSSSRGWTGQAITKRSNSELEWLYCYRNIDDYAFYGCNNLFASNIVLGKKVTYVGDYSFGKAGAASSDMMEIRGSVTFSPKAFNAVP